MFVSVYLWFYVSCHYTGKLQVQQSTGYNKDVWFYWKQNLIMTYTRLMHTIFAWPCFVVFCCWLILPLFHMVASWTLGIYCTIGDVCSHVKIIKCSEWVSLMAFLAHQGSCKPCNHNLYTGIITFSHTNIVTRLQLTWIKMKKWGHPLDPRVIGDNNSYINLHYIKPSINTSTAI